MTSKCGHCNGFSWELHTESPHGAAFKVNFIRCKLCKVPVGVVGYYDTHSKLEKLENTVTTLSRSVSSSLAVIDENIRRLFHK